MKTFPTVILGIFLALAVSAVLIFASYSGTFSDNVGTVVLWGSVPESVMNAMLDEIQITNPGLVSDTTYVYFPRESLVTELVPAIAAGRSPDLILFPAEELLSEDDKLLTIPYSQLSRRDFQDTFVEAGEVFLYADGMKAIPFVIDPLVMYWNRTLFAEAGISKPFTYWDEVSQNTRKLTKAEQVGTLKQSATAMGTWDNVTHAKAILLSLMRQLGNSVVSAREGRFVTSISEGSVGSETSSESALRFYVDFADPVKPVFSWNRSQPESREAFIGGRLAIYFGRASELREIREANPNLNFDVAELPRARGGLAASDALLIGLAIPRGATNPNGALTVASILYGVQNQQYIAGNLLLPSVRRDLLNSNPENAYEDVFQRAALTSFVFLDPEPEKSELVFKGMVENVLSGRDQPATAVKKADEELFILLEGIQ